MNIVLSKSKKSFLLSLFGILVLAFLVAPLGSNVTYAGDGTDTGGGSNLCPGGEKVPDDCKQHCPDEDKGGLVPCGRHCNIKKTKNVNECCPCTLCHVFLLANRLILFARNAAFLIATIMIVAGGAMMLLSGAYQGLRSKGKSIVTSAVTGLIIVLLAWVITASVLVVLAGRSNAEKYFNLKTASFKIQCTAD